MCISLLPTCMYGYHICAWCLQRSEGIRSPRTAVAMVLSCRVGARNRSRVLCKYKKCS